MREPLQLFYCDHHPLPLPPRQRFPAAKYRAVRERLKANAQVVLLPAPLASADNLRQIHAESYITEFLNGTLNPQAQHRIGFPWSEGLVDRTLASAGSTLAATGEALAAGLSGSIAGGTHHAFTQEGSGFCVFNDLAICSAWVRQFGIRRVAIVDLDVHQGDGTAKIFEDSRKVFTLSLHGKHHFPFRKQRSSLDVEFQDGANGAEYFPALEKALDRVWQFDPEFVFYQAGVDGLAQDRLGRLQLTAEDLKERDRLVIGSAVGRGIPLTITMGGGYSEPLEHTIHAHAQTFEIAARLFDKAKTRQRQYLRMTASTRP